MDNARRGKAIVFDVVDSTGCKGVESSEGCSSGFPSEEESEVQLSRFLCILSSEFRSLLNPNATGMFTSGRNFLSIPKTESLLVSESGMLEGLRIDGCA